MTNVTDVASWMKATIESSSMLYQEIAVAQIRQLFGDEFVYINDAGNFAILKAVLKAFKALTADTVVWDRGERVWRMRQQYDPPGRRQSY
jgi:hypothetical protein